MQEVNSDPNATQIGGDHYRDGDVQHWDIMIYYAANYFQGVITKYLWRYGKKEDTDNADVPTGLKDLRKSRHFCQKYRGNEYPPYIPLGVVERRLAAYFKERGWDIHGTRCQAIMAIMGNDTKRAEQLITRLIQEEYPSEPDERYTNQG